MNPTLRELIDWGTTRSLPRLEAELLLAHALGWSRTRLHTWPETRPAEQKCERYRSWVEQRAAGEPIAYLTGVREFWSLELTVTPDTLIPRPETELLVELALARIPTDAEWTIADLGTGSGAIALALATERPRCRIIATDRSAAALEVASANAWRHRLDRVHFHHGDWWQPLHGQRFHLVASNPPYVASGDPHLDRGDLPHEPRAALAAGPDGLDSLRTLATGCRDHLHPGGWLLLEHGFDQGAAVRALLCAAGLTEVNTHCDLAGLERATAAKAPAP